jgi:hypothetical protein
VRQLSRDVPADVGFPYTYKITVLGDTIKGKFYISISLHFIVFPDSSVSPFVATPSQGCLLSRSEMYLSLPQHNGPYMRTTTGEDYCKLSLHYTLAVSVLLLQMSHSHVGVLRPANRLEVTSLDRALGVTRNPTRW